MTAPGSFAVAELVVDQVRALAAADSPAKRLLVVSEIGSTGTGESLIRDEACGGEMTLLTFAAHLRHTTRPHGVHQVLVVEERQGTPLELVPDEPPTPAQVHDQARDRAQRRREPRAHRRRRPFTVDLDDPEIHARSAGRMGESATAS